MAHKAKVVLDTLAMMLFIDLGNALVKWILGDVESWMPHALAEITKEQYEEQVGSRGSANFSYVKLKNKYYAVGRAAEKFRVTRRLGRLKFERQYYGPFFCSIVARMFSFSPALLEQGLSVMASYAPDDFEWVSELKAALIGRWQFECGGIEWDFVVKRVQTYSEPFGSYALRAFVRNGKGEIETPLLGKQVGIVDFGGGTHSVLQIGPDGEVDELSGKSGQMGLNHTLDLFERMIYRDTKIKAKLPKARKLSRQILREAFRTGELVFSGKDPISVAHLVEPAGVPLLNEFSSLYYGFMDGGADQDEIIITGGGIVSLESQVRQILDHGNVTLSQEDLTTIHYANVRGARNFEEVNIIYA